MHWVDRYIGEYRLGEKGAPLRSQQKERQKREVVKKIQLGLTRYDGGQTPGARG